MSELRVEGPKSPVRHVRPVVSEARIARLWEQTRVRLEQSARARRWMSAGVFAGALALTAAAVVLVRAHHEPSAAQSVWEGAALETGGDALSVALSDGSELRLASRSRVEVEKGAAAAVRLVLRRGRVECDVTHRPGRSFVVAAGGVEVHVVGTRFSVSMDPNGGSTRVDVHVDRGAVQITSAEHPGHMAEVRAGQGWSEIEGAEREDAPAPAAPPEVSSVPAVPAAAPPSGGAAQGASREGAGFAASTPAAPHPASEPRVLGPRELLEEANRLRRDGKVREAAQAYESLLVHYPSDGRAGLSAFELGRLRMDRLSDMAGAVPALERAVELAPAASFREDAMARLVTAYARTGKMAECERARDHYLESYASGIHRQSVAAACDGR